MMVEAPMEEDRRPESSTKANTSINRSDEDLTAQLTLTRLFPLLLLLFRLCGRLFLNHRFMTLLRSWSLSRMFRLFWLRLCNLRWRWRRVLGSDAFSLFLGGQRRRRSSSSLR